MIKKQYIIMAAIAFFILIAFSIFQNRSNSGTLRISTPAKTPGNTPVDITVVTPGAKDQSFQLKPGGTKSLSIKKGNVRVNGSAGDLKSVDIVNVKGFKTTKLLTPSGSQQAIKQTGADTGGCPTIANNTLYTYGCGKEGPIYRQDNVLSTQSAYMFNDESFAYLQPVSTGLIGFYSNKDPYDLKYVDLQTESIKTVPFTNTLQGLIRNERPEISTANTSGKDGFVLAFNVANRIFLFKNPSDANPVELHLNKDVMLSDELRRVSVSYDGSQVLVYAGVNGEQGEGTNTDYKTPKIQSYIFEYNSSGKLVNTIKLPTMSAVSSMHKLTNNFYAAERDNGFSFYYYNNAKFNHIYDIDDTSSWVVSGGKLYFQVGGTLYQFTPKNDGLFSLQSRFTSTNMTVSALYDTPLGVIFTAFTGTSSSAPLDVYRLLNTPQQGNNPAVTTGTNFMGFDGLLYYGITDDQLSSLKTAFNLYTQQANIQTPVIQAQNIVPVQHDRLSESMIDTINFDVLINAKISLKARVDYSSLASIRLYLYEAATGSQIFDSANVNLQP